MNYPVGIKDHKVTALKSFGTNFNIADMPDDIAIRMKGVRNSVGGILLQRDFGTQLRFATLPTIPNYTPSVTLFIQDCFTLEDQTDGTTHEVLVCLDPDPNNAVTPAKVITNASNATPITITSNGHGFSNGDTVLVLGVVGNLAANGRWIIANVQTNTFDLVGSIGNGAYSSGGLATKTPNTRIFVDISANASGTWSEMSATVYATVNGTPGDPTATANINNIKQNSASFTLPAHALQYWIARNVNSGKLSIVQDNAATSVTCLANVSSTGLGWLSGDVVVFYPQLGTQKQIGNASPYVFSEGVNPHTRFNEIGTQRKVNLYLGSSATPPVMLNPLSIQNRPTRNYFWHNSSGGTMVFPSGFYMETYGGLENSFTQYGTKSGTLEGATSHTFQNLTPWCSLLISGTPTSPLTNKWLTVICVYITVVYGYQESDPIFLGFLNANHAGISYQILTETFQFNINPALMPKEVTGFNFYTKDFSDYNANTTALINQIADSQFLLRYFLPVQSYDPNFIFGIVPTAGDLYGQIFQASYTYQSQFTPAIGADIVSELGHAIQVSTPRTLLTPRFAMNAKNVYGAIVAVDQNDSTARFNSYDGSGSPEDDNFPDVSLDVNNQKQLAFLTGIGELQGIGVNDETFYFFRKFNVESVDLQSGIQRLIPCDFASKRSLCSHDMGVSWGGEIGIYLIRKGNNAIERINKDWSNFYDSTYLTDDGVTPFITQAYRDAIISGYDRYFNEIWFNCLVNRDLSDGGGTEWLNFRYSPQSRQWNIRKLNINGGVGLTAFSKRKDGTTTLVYGQGLLKYPNLTVFPYEDDVTSAGASQSRGFETRVVIHLGSLSGILSQISIYSAVLDYVGSTASGIGLFNLLVYANKESLPFDTEQFPLDGPCVPRRIQYRGRLEQLRVEINLPTTGTNDFQRMEINSITVNYVPGKRLGTR